MDIGACIAELLLSRDTVIVPGLGGFVASYKPAAIDHVQGVLSPPSQSVRFNENLVVDDGALVEALSQKYHISATQASEALRAFVEKARESLQRREIVELAGLGRLYLDYEKKYQFLQGSQNLNPQSYGLPPVQYYPVIRPHSGVAPKSANPVISESGGRKKMTGAWVQQPWFWILLLSVIFLGVSLYFIRQEMARKRSAELERINTRPSGGEVLESDTLEEEDLPLPVPSGPADTGAILEGETDTEAPTPRPDQRSVVVIVGAFKDSANAKGLIEELYKAGYDVYSDQQKGATRVGIQFSLESDSDTAKRLEEVRRRFNPKAWVLKAG